MAALTLVLLLTLAAHRCRYRASAGRVAAPTLQPLVPTPAPWPRLCSRAVDPCAEDQSCVPTRADYDLNADGNATVAPLGRSHWVECRGRYALCAFAKCVALEGTDPPLAECGCYVPDRPSWYVTPRQLKSKALFDLTSGYCYEGDAWTNNNTNCADINSAPACTAIEQNWVYSGNYERISTFTPTNGVLRGAAKERAVAVAVEVTDFP